MDKMLDHYSVVAERKTGFWITLPVCTGYTVSREEWLRMQHHNPDHYQIIELVPDDEVLLQSETDEVIVEQALSVMWSDETLQ